jgi:Ca-activated chloride channel family protein
MNDIVQNFQFIRPEWLWALLAILIIYALKLRFGKDQNVWQQLIPAHLYKQMIVRKSAVASNKFVHLSMASLLIAVIAIAGPTWEKLPQMVYQTQAGKVILMDMSMSMRASDLSPNRLTRARFKAIDLVNEVKEGETGLVAYAGDAFVVSPLTDDINNLTTLIPVLTPEIMPIKGSSALTGLLRSASLLQDAGYQQGQIYWVTDGIRYDEIGDIRNFIIDSPFEVSALLVGTEAGAPIPMEDGQLLKDFTGKIVVPSINSRYMNQAMAGTKGKYHLFANDDSDIQAIKRNVAFDQQQRAKEVDNATGDTFKDMGPYLLLLLLPVAAYSFRKGVLSVAILGSLLLGLGTSSPRVFAVQSQPLPNTVNVIADQEINQNSPRTNENLLDRVFKNADQRGKIAFDENDYAKAQNLFEDSAWLAASAYKSGDFERAEALYKQLIQRGSVTQSALMDNVYNKGNALARQGKLEDALNAYNEVLKSNPEHQHAKANKQLVEELLEQQQQEQQRQDSQEEQDEQDGEQDQNQDSSQENSEEQQGQDAQDQQSQSQDSQPSDSQPDGSQQQQSPSSEKSDENSAQENREGQQEEQQTSDESLKQEAQKQKTQEQQNAKQSQAEQQSKENEASAEQQSNEAPQRNEQAQTEAISNQVNTDDLTPEQKEELQRMQMILNKIPDDPAYLLMRKMQLEAYKRRNDPSPPIQENW